MSISVIDLYAVRPICSLCCCAFSYSLPAWQMSCRHLFCQQCLTETARGDVFICPFDNLQSQVFGFSSEFLSTIESVLSNPQQYSSPDSYQYLCNIYTTLQPSINFYGVPCRYFTRTQHCHPSLSRCLYDHSRTGVCMQLCPLGLNCHRREFCPYSHPPSPVQMAVPTGMSQARSQAGFHYHREPQWLHTQSGTIIAPLSITDAPYQKISQLFSLSSVSHAILRIDEVRNVSLYTKFAYKHESACQTEDCPLKLMQLFYGSGTSPPANICNSPVGIDMRNAQGPYGKGSHFSKSPSYAIAEAYKLPDGSQQILYCIVLVGDFHDYGTKTNTKLCRPPQKPNTGMFYHSVKGSVRGSDVYVTYDNETSYPGFIITFR